MPRFLMSFICIDLCLAFAHHAAAQPAELVVNGGLESGLSGWSGVGVLCNDRPHGGTACLEINDTDAKRSVSVSTPVIAVTNGQRYRLSFWVRAQAAGQRVSISMSQCRSDGSRIPRENQDISTFVGTSWTRVSADVRARATETASVSLSLRPVVWTGEGELQGRAWFDDISLIPVPEPAPAGHPLDGVAAEGGGGPGLWVAPAEQKVTPGMVLPIDRDAVSEITFAAARNEYEPRQLVLVPASGSPGTLVSAVVSPGVGPGGATLPASAFDLREVAYVNVTVPTDSISLAGEYPDPLPPLVLPLALKPGRNVPLWITLHVPGDAAAGVYTGTLMLTYGSGAVQRVAWSARVRSFALPPVTRLGGCFGLDMSTVARQHHLGSDSELRRKVFRLYLRDFVAHRRMPRDVIGEDGIKVTFPQGSDEPEVDFSAFDEAASFALDELGISNFCLHLPHFAHGGMDVRSLPTLHNFAWGSVEYERVYVNILAKIEAHLASRGWLEKASVYWYDEPQSEADFALVAQGMSLIKRGAPRLCRLLTEPYTPSLDGLVDRWVPLLYQFDEHWGRARQDLGEEVWWYVCTSPRSPYSTNFIDHPGIEIRMRTWMAWSVGVTGELYWSMNYLNAPKVDPWLEDPRAFAIDAKDRTGSGWGNGDGRLVYPPRSWKTDTVPRIEGPVPSQRWELLREGAEDYDVLCILREACDTLAARGGHEALVARARGLLAVPRTLTSSTTQYSGDPATLSARRDVVDAQLEQVLAALSK